MDPSHISVSSCSHQHSSNQFIIMGMLTLATLSAVLVALSTAHPQFSQSHFGQRAQVPVLSRTEERHDNGQFSFNYQTGDGQTFQETGVPKRNFQNDGDVITKKGFYSYTSPEGVLIKVNYVADEFGYHPDNLPQPVQPIKPTF